VGLLLLIFEGDGWANRVDKRSVCNSKDRDGLSNSSAGGSVE
jgi:hypothetical protein